MLSGVAIRKPGGGRKRTMEQDETLVRDLERLIEPLSRLIGEVRSILCNADPRVRPLVYCVQYRRSRKTPAYNLYCTQVFHARDRLQMPILAVFR